METIMVTGGLGFTDPQITKRLAAGGHRVVSYNRDFAPREDEIVMAQGSCSTWHAWCGCSKLTASDRS